MADRKAEMLKKVPLFAHCSTTSLESVTSNTDEVDVEKGRTLIKQGQPSDTFYVLLDGEADVVIGGEHRRSLGPGDFFGEISMLDRGPATATITTTARAAPPYRTICCRLTLRKSTVSSTLSATLSCFSSLRVRWVDTKTSGWE